MAETNGTALKDPFVGRKHEENDNFSFGARVIWVNDSEKKKRFIPTRPHSPIAWPCGVVYQLIKTNNVRNPLNLREERYD